jgi:hypothetical protein
MKKTAIALVAFLSVSGVASAQTEIDNLVATSQDIVTTIKEAGFAVSGMGYYAGVGGITPDGFADAYKLTEQSVDSYNQALQAVKDATFYNAKMMFEDKHDEAMDNLSLAVDSFVLATEAIVEVVTVNEMATEANTTEGQLAVQSYIQTNDVEITQAEVSAYNTSLDDVESYAQQAAAFLQASNDSYITSATDNEAQAYNNASYEANVTYNAANDFLQVTWQSGYSHGYVGFFNADFKTAEDIMGMGQSIYEGNTLN